MSFRRGDLIQLENEEGVDISHSGWCYGVCERTGLRGDFPSECVYVLPTLVKPASEILVGILYSYYCCFIIVIVVVIIVIVVIVVIIVIIVVIVVIVRHCLLIKWLIVLNR